MQTELTKEQIFVRTLISQRNDALNACAQITTELEFTRTELSTARADNTNLILEVGSLRDQLASARESEEQSIDKDRT